MSKHTPGPWQYTAKLSGSENHRGFRVWGPDGWVLADIEPADEDGKRGEANARLIAAAPELLKALKLALSAHGKMLLSDPPQEAWKAYGVEQKARAAINAAEDWGSMK